MKEKPVPKSGLFLLEEAYFFMSWRALSKTICGVKPAESRYVPVTDEEPVEEPLLNVLRQAAGSIG